MMKVWLSDIFPLEEEDLPKPEKKCKCGNPAEWDCATCLNDYCGYCAESHILSRHEIGRII